MATGFRISIKAAELGGVAGGEGSSADVEVQHGRRVGGEVQ
jgi:hypothetical protein